MGFIKNLYNRTNNRINKATTMMNYTLSAAWSEKTLTKHEKDLGKMLKRYENLVGPQNVKHRAQIMDSRMDPKEKIKSLLRHVRVTSTQSFIYFVRNITPQMLAEKLRIMDSVHEILLKVSELKLSNTDKMCNIRLAAAKLLGHLFARQNEYDILSDSTIGQLEDWVVFYSLDLIEENFEHPDPYFFYLMLIWPCLDEDKQTEVSRFFDNETFKKCLRKLNHFEDHFWKGRSSFEGNVQTRFL